MTLLYQSIRLRAPLRLQISARPFPVRHASLNSAIGRGIRQSDRVKRDDPPRKHPRDREDRRHDRENRRSEEPPSKPRRDDRDSHRKPMIEDFDEDEFIRTGNFRALPKEHQRFESMKAPKSYRQGQKTGHVALAKKKKEKPKFQASESAPSKVKESVKVPDHIPYTTPASEFIYGTSAIEAVLRCERRRPYVLYIYQPVWEELSEAKIKLRKLALSKGVKVKMAFGDWFKLLDQMSAGRAHNGCVLEASPLPRLPVESLQAIHSPEEDHFSVQLGRQTREQALVNGMNGRIKINSLPQRSRYPVLLMLEGITDTGNVGAIVRSAYFLGIDAIIFAGKNSAPFNPVTIKASAGAAEHMPLLEAYNEVNFIRRSQANGWRFYAADAPRPGSAYIDPSSNVTVDADGNVQHNENPLTQSPSVIMMGSEHAGLSHHIMTHADSIVSIPGSRFSPDLGVESDPARVDSLNVSVAAALLMGMFLQTPIAAADAPEKAKRSQ